MKTITKMALTSVCIAVLSACGGGSSSGTPTSSTPTPTPAPDDGSIQTTDVTDTRVDIATNTNFADEADTVLYRITIDNQWNPDDYPDAFPEDAHFSHLGGATHNDTVSFWNYGEQLTPAMVWMAETGNVDQIVQQDFQQAMDNDNAYSTIWERRYTPEQLPGPGTSERIIRMHPDFPLVTFVTMLGPSPDWFVGVSGYDLTEAGEWQDSASVDLVLYDGGSEDGTVPRMQNPASAVQEEVHWLTYQTDTGDYVRTETPIVIGSMTFERLEQ